ncbi:MAG: hypothetical protein IH986_13340 [Planctomycetes bacterium]|nr:hypothetical protein [Planctomycetota bacterium]
MNRRLYERLIEVASAQKCVYYREIAPLVNLDMSLPPDRAEIGRLLGEVSQHEHALGRPLLSLVVISHEGNKPGKGFFTLARDLGVYTGPDEDTYWNTELKRVWAASKRESKRK